MLVDRNCKGRPLNICEVNMKTKLAFCWWLLMPLILIACGTTASKQRKPNVQYVATTLAKGVEEKSDLAVPVGPGERFTTIDEKVVAHLEFANLSGSCDLRWDWYSPDGALYLSSGDFPVTIAKDRFVRQATVWHSLNIKGDRAAALPGEWVVKVFYNDDLVDTRSFQLDQSFERIVIPEGVSRKPYPKDWGLIIGIEDYAHLPKVEYARKDALIVRDYFERILGVPEENIIMLLDSDATKARIEGFLQQYIPANVKPGTTLYVYFAGHGAPDVNKGQPYLVPFDGDIRFLSNTGYLLKSFYDDINKLNIRHSYVFLDSCFSGMASRAAEMLIKDARPVLIHAKEVQVEKDKLVALSASSAGQVSHPFPETEHGLFTYYLLRALGGEADSDDDNWVSVKEIYDYVRRHVSREARKMGREQTPVIMPAAERLKDVAIGEVLW
jgi:hypothetical protein